MMTIETVAPAATTLTVDLWTDLGCPWCYIGTRRLEQAIDDSGVEARIELHSFELHPESHGSLIETIPEIFVRMHGGSLENARTQEAQITTLANAEGLPFTTDRPAVNTFDVHRLLQLAKTEGVGTEYFTKVQTEYFAGRLNPYDHNALLAVAALAGVPKDRAHDVLVGDTFAAAVLEDRRRGLALGVSGLPFAVYGGKVATSGAQSVEGFTRAITAAIGDGS